MRKYPKSKIILRVFFVAIWVINGFYYKVLNLVPRHHQIVARILGNDHSQLLTKAIGVLEILMAVWVLSNLKSRWCTIIQIIAVATMNIIEFILAPDLLLFGRFNIVVATIFIGVLVLNEFVFNSNTSTTTITTN